MQMAYLSRISNFFSVLSSTWIARISLFIGIMMVSSAGLFIKLSEKEITPFAIAFHRLWIATLAFFLFKIIDSRLNSGMDVNELPQAENNLTYTNIVMLVVAGVVRATVLIIFGYSLLYTNVTNFTLLNNLSSLFIPIFLGLTIIQKLDHKFWLGWLITILGLGGIVINDLRMTPENVFGDSLALFASFLTAFYYIIKEKLVVELSVNTILRYVCLIGALILLPLTLTTSDKIFPESLSGWISIIGLGILCQFMGHGLITYSLKHLSSSLVTLCLPLEVILASVWSKIFLVEKLSSFDYLSCVIVLVGVCIATFSPSTIKSQESKEHTDAIV
jgi:drug/metabolite transporter (DMT)-like permease